MKLGWKWKTFQAEETSFAKILGEHENSILEELRLMLAGVIMKIIIVNLC